MNLETFDILIECSNCRQSLLDYHYPWDFSFVLG